MIRIHRWPAHWKAEGPSLWDSPRSYILTCKHVVKDSHLCNHQGFETYFQLTVSSPFYPREGTFQTSPSMPVILQQMSEPVAES